VGQVEHTPKVMSVAGTKGSPLRLKEEQLLAYFALGAKPRTKVATIEIARRTGEAFELAKGQILRVINHEGPQVADFNAFAKADPHERFWSIRSRIIGGSHLTAGHQLWSCPPWTRPMLTIVNDTVERTPQPNNVATHDLIFTRCDARHYELVFGKAGAPNCQDNLAGAIAKYGLGAHDVHDPLNLFMTTGLNEEGRPIYVASAAKTGDFVDLYAEMDCIIAISACPGGSSGDEHKGLRCEIFNVEGNA